MLGYWENGVNNLTSSMYIPINFDRFNFKFLSLVTSNLRKEYGVEILCAQAIIAKLKFHILLRKLTRSAP